MKRLQRKFIFRGGCNHCGVAGHKRQECSDCLALKAKNNGQLPKGYKGEREKAFDKRLAELKSKKPTDASAKPKAKPKAKSVRALT